MRRIQESVITLNMIFHGGTDERITHKGKWEVMTRDEILYVARNHWLYDLENPNEELALWLVEFANRIAAREREACAEMCEHFSDLQFNYDMKHAYKIAALGIRRLGDDE